MGLSSLRRLVGPLALTAALGGCASGMPAPGPDAPFVEHVLSEPAHPWHSYPAVATTAVVLVPLMAVTSPVWLLVPGEDNTHAGTTFPVCMAVAAVPGLLVGGVLYVGLYPLEWVVPVPAVERPPDRPARDADLPPGGEPAPFR